MTDIDAAALPEEQAVAGVDETIAVSRLSNAPAEAHPTTTDAGNAERFAQLFKHITRYLTDLERWVLWNGNRWELDVPGDLKTFALTLGVTRLIRHEATLLPDVAEGNGISPQERHQRFAAASEAISRRQAMVRSAAALPELQALSTDFDVRKDVIACEGRLLLLGDITENKAGKKKVQISDRPLRRDDMIMYHTKVCYRPEVLDDPPPLARLYLETFIPDEIKQKMIFKTLGACLVGGNEHRLFVIIQGESTTGKTQLAEAIYATLGKDYATVATASVFRGNQDDKPRPDILKAVPKRIAIFSEASKAWELHADRVKDLTGGGTISARLMRENEFVDVKPNFTPILVTNALPKIVGADPALMRRMLVFEFNRKPFTEDPTIRDKFVNDPSVHEWLLARMVQGYVESVEEGLSDVIVAQGLATMEAFDNLTHLGSFVRWLTDTDQLSMLSGEEQAAYGVKSTYVSLKEMYDRYSFWVKEYATKRDQHEKLDYESFNDQLKNNGWERVKSGSWRWVGKRLISLHSWQYQEATGGPS